MSVGNNPGDSPKNQHPCVRSENDIRKRLAQCLDISRRLHSHNQSDPAQHIKTSQEPSNLQDDCTHPRNSIERTQLVPANEQQDDVQAHYKNNRSNKASLKCDQIAAQNILLIKWCS